MRHVGTAALGCPGELARQVPFRGIRERTVVLPASSYRHLQSAGQPRAAVPTLYKVE